MAYHSTVKSLGQRQAEKAKLRASQFLAASLRNPEPSCELAHEHYSGGED